MSRAAFSMLVFGIYVVVLASFFVFIPNTILALFHIPTTDEAWIRCLGMMMGMMGCYNIMASRIELTPLFRWTIYGRCSVPFFLGAFVLLDMMAPIFLFFGFMDVAFAMWTAFALKADQRDPNNLLSDRAMAASR